MTILRPFRYPLAIIPRSTSAYRRAMLRRMKTETEDYQAMVEKGRWIFWGIYLVVGAILGLLWFVSATFGMIAGAWGMLGAIFLWFLEDAVKP
jgi:hypothetical protein